MNAEPLFDFLEHLRKQVAWSLATFGPGERTAGVIDHIRKELREIEADPRDLEEWIDVVILALDGAWRSGASPEAIVAQLVANEIMRRLAREKADLRAEVERLRTIITSAATQIRVAHEKEDDGAPCSASNHYEEVLNMLANHAGAWSPECAKLRDFTTLGVVCKENADLRAKLAAYEAHQGCRALIPGNLIDRIDEHGQEWTRTDRVRSAVAALVQPQTVEEITRLREKLAAAEERIAGVVAWTHQYGDKLCPFGNYTDSFGDGMRAAKAQVSSIAELGGA